MSAAADAEDKTEKHPVTPGVPGRRANSTASCCSTAECQGSARRLRGDAQERAEPAGRLCGSGASAEKAGDNAKATAYYEKVVAIAEGADVSRTEVADARARLKKT